jgi:hypothetical protein
MAADTPDTPEPVVPFPEIVPVDVAEAVPVDVIGGHLETIPIPASQGDVVPLLIKAVGMLPEAERDQVYAWVLERGLGAPPPRLARQLRVEMLTQQTATRSATQPGSQQVVPVRFPADQHAELRRWCTDHGFSMATVIRGLVARFLEGQLRADG